MSSEFMTSAQTDSKNEVEQLLTDNLPDDACDVSYHFYNPGTNLVQYTAYLKFQCSPVGFSEFVGALGLETRAEQLSPHLPAAWGLPRGLALEWWDAESNTPENAAAKSLENAGWIVAKYENQTTYLIVAGQLG